MDVIEQLAPLHYLCATDRRDCEQLENQHHGLMVSDLASLNGKIESDAQVLTKKCKDVEELTIKSA